MPDGLHKFKIKKEIKFGIIFAAVLFTVFWGFNFLKGKDLFKLTDDYVIFYPDVNGLLESNPVLVKGYKVGQIKYIEIDKTNNSNIKVTISIESGIIIPKGTKAEIMSIDLMGSKGIDLKLSSSTLRHVEHDTLIGISEIPFLNKIDPIKDKAEQILNSVDTIVNSVKLMFNANMINELRKTLTNLQLITNNIVSQKDHINNTLFQLESISENFAKQNKNITEVLNNINDITDTVKNLELNATILQIRQTFASIDSLLYVINNGNSTISKLKNDDSIYIEMNKTLISFRNLTDDINKNPKKYINISVFGKK